MTKTVLSEKKSWPIVLIRIVLTVYDDNLAQIGALQQWNSVYVDNLPFKKTGAEIIECFFNNLPPFPKISGANVRIKGFSSPLISLGRSCLPTLF
jgi:hypothetical protein